MQSTRTPIFIHEESQKSLNIYHGSTEKYRLKLTNSDNKELLVIVWIKANDTRSKPLERWCTIRTIIDDQSSINNRLRLKQDESQYIELQFDVPQKASAGTYNYTVFAEAPEQYPDQVFRRPQQLRVRLEREAKWDYEPEFILPPTNPNKPHELQAGEEVEIPIQVKNRSKLVDRFYIICPDLDEDWYDVRYPEVNTNLPGLVRETDGLELNPEDPPGEIQLILHPPKYTPAGNYFPTIRLISKNNESQLIIRVFYLLILPEYDLRCKLQPPKNKVKKGEADFEIELINEGNTRRDIILTSNFIRQEKLWTSSFYPGSELRLYPSKSKTFNLHVQRKGWGWRRLIPRPALELPFDVELEDVQNRPLDDKSLEGILTWDKSPWWHLWLLILLALGILVGTALAIWLNFFKMPPSPKIREFKTLKLPINSQGNNEEDKYKQGESIPIQWEVRHPQELEKIAIARVDSQGSREVKSYLFKDAAGNFSSEADTRYQCRLIASANPNFFQEIMSQFRPNLSMNENQSKTECQIENGNISQCNLQCNLNLDPPPPDKYILEIEAFPRPIDKLFKKRSSNQASDSRKTDTFEVMPKPQPLLSQIDQIASPKSIYSKLQEEEIILQFEIKNKEQLAKLDIVTQDNNQVTKTSSYILENSLLKPRDLRNTWGNLVCQKGEKPGDLSCQWSLNTRFVEPGNYTFKVAAYSLSNPQDPSDSQSLQNTIIVQPEPLPELEQFIVSKKVYEEAQKEPIKLNWVIQNPSQIKELIVTAQSQTGSPQEIKRYQYPGQVSQFCSIPTTVTLPLVCRDVPTTILPPGEYTFQLDVIPKTSEQSAKINRTSPLVKVTPTPIKMDFQVNGQPIVQPVENYQPIAISPEGTPVFIQFGWKVEGGEGMQVELLPIAGVVQPEGSITYTISQAPISETITLQVTNSLGEQETRSIVIQTYESSSSSPSQFAFPKTGELETPDSDLIQPVPAQPGRLEPIELPPKPD